LFNLRSNAIRVQRRPRGGEGLARLPEQAYAEFPRRITRYDPDVSIDGDWRGFLTAFELAEPFKTKHQFC
jgi:hypothetical protein